jgi:hypothetical protein
MLRGKLISAIPVQDIIAERVLFEKIGKRYPEKSGILSNKAKQ